jgi:tetratricopeptide (TPR) repeat protein
VRSSVAVAGACLLVVVAIAGAQESGVIDLRGTQATRDEVTFRALWAAREAAVTRGSEAELTKALTALREARVERNIENLDVVGLALVTRGLKHLRSGDIEAAEEDFELAVELDPHLPDAHFALARARLKQGPLGLVSAVKETALGYVVRLPTVRGRAYLGALLIASVLLGAFAGLFVFALALVLRYGPLLRHDIEEAIGGDWRRPIALVVYVAILLAPGLALEGYGWLPLWWLALLFIYFRAWEKGVVVAILVASFLVGPGLFLAERRVAAWRNPLFRAALTVTKDGPDLRALALVEDARRKNVQDLDFAYLAASENKKLGRYDDASAVYRQILQTAPSDIVALNNLANLEFATAEFQTAIARYQAAIAATSDGRSRATLYYNLSLAHLQRFEYQPAEEARSQADRIDGDVVNRYESQWRVLKDGSAIAKVVDMGLTAGQLLDKFDGDASGAGRPNAMKGAAPALPWLSIIGRLFNRFALFAAVFVVVIFAQSKWRGKKAFTMACLKCGVPFCRKCHLGAAVGGLCTQCHHLFLVRDGVSGPARNQKLLEVQREDVRRERIFRGLSLLSPGMGHVYGRRTVVGLLISVAWYTLIAVTLLAGRLLSVTEASSRLVGPWGLGLAALVLVVIYVMANRGRLDTEVVVPLRRGVTRPRGR